MSGNGIPARLLTPLGVAAVLLLAGCSNQTSGTPAAKIPAAAEPVPSTEHTDAAPTSDHPTGAGADNTGAGERHRFRVGRRRADNGVADHHVRGRGAGRR